MRKLSRTVTQIRLILGSVINLPPSLGLNLLKIGHVVPVAEGGVLRPDHRLRRRRNLHRPPVGGLLRELDEPTPLFAVRFLVKFRVIHVVGKGLDRVQPVNTGRSP